MTACWEKIDENKKMKTYVADHPWVLYFALGPCIVAHPLLLHRAVMRGQELVGGIEK